MFLGNDTPADENTAVLSRQPTALNRLDFDSKDPVGWFTGYGIAPVDGGLLLEDETTTVGQVEALLPWKIEPAELYCQK